MTVLPDDGPSPAAEFPDATRAQWQRLVEGVLRKSGTSEASGAAAEEVLSTEIENGLRVRPLYTADDVPEGTAGPPVGYPGFPPFLRGGVPAGNVVSGWDVRQRHRRPDARRANEAVLADLEHGVSSLWLVLGRAGTGVGELPTVLEGVCLDLAPVVLDAGADFEAAAGALLRLYAEREVPPSAASGNLGADPLGLLARTGQGEATAEWLAAAVALARRAGTYPGLRALTVDALPYHEAGGSSAEELGCSLATGVAYLRQLTAAGMGIEGACGQLEFRYAATADQFLTIAKLRAARRLWARVAEVCGVRSAAGAQRQHAVTSPVMMTRRDPWVNILRTTVASLAAGVGGADAVTVLPFDHEIGLSDAFARRIARNTSTILVEESHVARVIDPAGGSWYVERLTDELARAAWSWFQEIERHGGQQAALRDGFVPERLERTWRRRAAGLAHRREPVTGVSEFPLPAEEPLVREPAPEEPGGGGLPRVRRDEAYEALRARSDAALAATGERPKVLLAALGPAAAYTARAAFAANLFRAGGVMPVQEEVSEQSAAEALKRSGATIACLCAGEEVHDERAEAVAAALRAAGARKVLRAGADGLVAGGDAVALLTGVLDELGVA
jgi:methylmalonyl-CoA mutase